MQRSTSAQGRRNKYEQKLIDNKNNFMSPAAKDFIAGTDIDLVCNCRRFRGQDDAVGLQAKYPCDCHGYTLKKYIEFLANS